MKLRYLLVALFLMFGLLFLPLSTAKAIDARSGEQVVIAAGEVVNDDLYVAANELVIDGEVNGDVYFFGETLTINGRVSGDVVAFGQWLIINGEVGDDLRLAGVGSYLGEQARVGGDLIAFGSGLELRPGSRVGQDVVFFGSQAYLGGEIGRHLRLGAEGVVVEGKVDGDAWIAVSGQRPTSPSAYSPAPVSMTKIPGGLTLKPSARIEGDLTYSAPKPLADVERYVGGKVTFEERQVEALKVPSLTERALDALRYLVTLLFFGFLAAWLSPRLLQQAAPRVSGRFLPSLGWGVLAYAVFFFALFILALVTLIGGVFFGVMTLRNISAVIIFGGIILVAVLLFAFIVVTVYLTKILVGWEGGRWILQKVRPELADHRYAPLVGVGLLALLVQLPYVGWAIALLALFLGLGALWLHVKEDRRQLTIQEG